ncbi:MAG: carbamoyltransferase HypF [Anaerolineae bacterium]|nr:carbamoyltransferase HypF [Anaerolineae bacterium]
MTSNHSACYIYITGVVQGVGFRPFVYNLAVGLGLTGWVLNSSAGVEIEAVGPAEVLDEFAARLRADAPSLARIEAVAVEPRPLPAPLPEGFVIRHSEARPGDFQPISPDIAICDDCRHELFDPNDRRYHYPFINCTNCGPRFTIIRDIPYDRPKTTMAPFPMCPACQAEYDDPTNRRFHAQPNACPVCGPQVELKITALWDFAWRGIRSGGLGGLRPPKPPHLPSFHAKSQRPKITNEEMTKDFDHFSFPHLPFTGEEAVRMTRSLLGVGGIVAVKGLGGFHLACDATNADAVARLRERKGRVGKPFALMAFDLETVERFCFVTEDERALLTTRERPIVLLRRRPTSPIAPLVAPGNGTLGVMLPYTPLHYLLLEPTDIPEDLSFDHFSFSHFPLALVMTSGNLSEEPIATSNEEALERLVGLADAFLLHNREIHARCDDSVTRIFAGVELPVRRSRGYAPYPVHLPFSVGQVLAVGGELKNTFCLTRDRYAFVSQHIGDVQNYETLRFFEQMVEQLARTFRIEPQTIVCDMHPGYLTTQWATGHIPNGLSFAVPHVTFVQHHHAHIAACMAENGLTGERPVIGVALDGTGYGSDGAIWGGEVLVADYAGFRRVAHLAYLPLPGGDAAIRRPYRTALAALWAAEIPWDEDLPPVASAPPAERAVLARQLERGVNVVPASSAGRLFDVVSALAGVCQQISYEAQAAIELEALVEDDPGAYPFDFHDGEIDPAPVLRAAVADLRAGVPVGAISARFHNGLALAVRDVCCQVREETGLDEVALSGGVFQNVTLLGRTVPLLEAAGFRVYRHRLVPPNDGCIALGQAVVAGVVSNQPDTDKHG